MRLTVTKVVHMTRLGVGLAAASPFLVRVIDDPYGVGSPVTLWPMRFILGVSMATLAFAAAPRWRRSDLTGLVIAYALCLFLADRWQQGTWRFDGFVACACGGCAVFICSCLETLRRSARLAPEADLSEIYPARRRSDVRIRARPLVV